MALGLTDMMLRRRLASGALVMARPGVYVLPGHTFTPQMLLRAATYALPGVVSHESAAEIHDLPYVPRGMAVISVPHRTTNRFPEVVLHQSTDLFPHHIEEIDGLRITTVPRTIFDLASRLRPRRIRMLVEQAVVERKCALDELTTIKDELARRGRPGSASFREVLCEIGPGVALSESALELAGMGLIRDAGLPEPHQQLELPWRDTRRRSRGHGLSGGAADHRTRWKALAQPNRDVGDGPQAGPGGTARRLEGVPVHLEPVGGHSGRLHRQRRLWPLRSRAPPKAFTHRVCLAEGWRRWQRVELQAITYRSDMPEPQVRRLIRLFTPTGGRSGGDGRGHRAARAAGR